jgi:hypothetical protein
LAVFAAAGVTALGATAFVTHGRHGRPAVHVGCPHEFSAEAVRPSLIDGAITAARAVVIDHRTEANQGRVTRRTRQNYWLSDVRLLFESRGSLFRTAVRRCGVKVARFSWALVFHDGESPVASAQDVRFAIRMPDGWWVY